MRGFQTAIANVREGVRTGNVAGTFRLEEAVRERAMLHVKHPGLPCVLTNKRLFERIGGMMLASAPDVSTRSHILDAAERHFAERGFDGASVRDIAGDAGLRNQASLYHYFENKQRLYEAVLQRGVGLLIDVVSGSDANSSLAPYLDRVLDYLVVHPHLAMLMQRVSLDESAAAREIVSRVLQPLFAEGLRLLGDSRGGWRDEDLPHVAAGLYQLIFGYFADAALLRTVMRDDPMNPDAIARQRRFVHEAIARLLGADSTTQGGR